MTMADEKTPPMKAVPQVPKKSKNGNRFRIPLIIGLNVLCIGYYGFVASPEYVSHAQVVVNNPQSSSSNLKSMLAGSSQSSPDGAYMIKSIAQDWTEFKSLDRQFDLARVWEKGDFVSRYGSLWSLFQKSDVKLHGYYNRSVVVKVDENTGQASYSILAFSSVEAKRIADALLRDTQHQIDRENEREELDYVSAAAKHVAKARQAIIDDEVQLSALRNTSGIVDPTVYYTAMMEQVSKLNTQSIMDEAQYQSIIRDTPNNPVANSLRVQKSVILNATNETQGHINALGPVVKEYEALKIRLKVDTNLLSQAQIALQQSELQSSQNHYYMHVISAPSNPEAAEKPYSYVIIGLVLLFSVLIWFFS